MTDFSAVERVITELIAAESSGTLAETTQRRLAATVAALSTSREFMTVGRQAADDFLAGSAPKAAMRSGSGVGAQELAARSFVVGLSHGVAATIIAFERGRIE